MGRHEQGAVAVDNFESYGDTDRYPCAHAAPARRPRHGLEPPTQTLFPNGLVRAAPGHPLPPAGGA